MLFLMTECKMFFKKRKEMLEQKCFSKKDENGLVNYSNERQWKQAVIRNNMDLMFHLLIPLFEVVSVLWIYYYCRIDSEQTIIELIQSGNNGILWLTLLFIFIYAKELIFKNRKVRPYFYLIKKDNKKVIKSFVNMNEMIVDRIKNKNQLFLVLEKELCCRINELSNNYDFKGSFHRVESFLFYNKNRKNVLKLINEILNDKSVIDTRKVYHKEIKTKNNLSSSFMVEKLQLLRLLSCVRDCRNEIENNEIKYLTHLFLKIA